MHRTRIVLLSLALALLLIPVAQAATPAGGTVAKNQDVNWTGGPFYVPNPAGCTSELDPSCDHFHLHVDGSIGTRVAVAITTDDPAGNDFDLAVYGPDGTLLATSATATGTENLVFEHTYEPWQGPYEVRVQPWLVTPGATYEGVAMRTGDPIDVARECLQAVPEALSLDFTQNVDLRVMVLLDGVSKSRGEYVMQTAASSYTPLNVTLSWKLRTQSFTTDDAEGLIQGAKDLFGGARPNGFDLVYVLTNKDIQVDGETGVAGLADCIGGVAYPETAFAVGEDFGAETDAGQQLGPFTHTTNGTAVVAAHELGHLMGAHHHYGNCVEGATALELIKQELTPCTLMFNFVNLASLPFSAVNSTVVRGHSVDFASP